MIFNGKQLTVFGNLGGGNGEANEILDSLIEIETITTQSVNINDGVWESGYLSDTGTNVGATGEQYPTYNSQCFRNANYIPVEGGRTIAIYYDAATWNNNNIGKDFYLCQYDSDKNIVGQRTTMVNYKRGTANVYALDASTAFIRVAFHNWADINTALTDIKVAIYYQEDAVQEFVEYGGITTETYMIRRDKVNGLEPLRGKRIVYDGDSIAESCSSNGGGYAKIIADYTGGLYNNQSVGGARLCAHSERHSVVNNLENLPKDGDIYCFQGGINDYWGNTAIGECTETFTDTVDASTVCGALETIFRYALDNFVGKPICFVITHKIQNAFYAKNTNGNTFKDYRDAMVKVCEKYSIPYYDAFYQSGLNGWNNAQNSAYFRDEDGTHPNAEGYKRYYVPQLLALFRSMMPVE